MKFNDAFQGKYLKAADLGGKPLRATIDAIKMEEVGGEKKVVASFSGMDQKLVVNKTNATALKDAWGDDMDDWCGNQLLLKADKTPFNGKLVPCIRVEAVAKKTAPGSTEAASDDVGF